MGRPKQLLPYRGTTLLRHAVNTAMASRCGRVIVVVGSEEEAMRRELAGLPVEIASNPDWPTGMGSSIRAGLALIPAPTPIAAPCPSGVLIMLCDQPGITADLLDKLMNKHASEATPVVACSYAGVAGVPALFDTSLFDELRQLDPSAGAAMLIKRHGIRSVLIPFPSASVDVDTPDDYERLLRS